MRILIIQGSPRHPDSCSGEQSKTRTLIPRAIGPFAGRAEFDFLDLAVAPDATPVQPCKGCVSTANGYHCHWPCSCYGPKAFDDDDRTTPDLMHDRKVYQRMKAADAFLLFSPVHWYAVPTSVKAMFDRLACANLTLTREQAAQYGFGKDPTKTQPAEQSGRHDRLLKNHLAGKVAGFFIHGDGGANDYTKRRPPGSYRAHQGSPTEPDVVDAVMPIVWQCRWSGITVPDDLIVGVTSGKGVPYSENRFNEAIIGAAHELINRVINRIESR